ncbi:MAG: NAD(P)H-dependent oxidoreductase [Leptospiraceae bacterium]|nr:NAD(P)H-dependent oxidoreductase [Leptospiraceae bacterium]
MKKILIIQGHPGKESLCSSIAKAYYEEAEKSGYSIRLMDLNELKFDLTLHVAYKSEQKLEPDLILAQQYITEADHLVFVFPNWWSSMPALLKGFIDRTFLPGFAFKYRAKLPLPEKLLKNKTARIIITMDSPPWYYKWFAKAPGLNALKKGTLEFSGISPVKSTLLGPVRKAPQSRIDFFLNVAKNLGNKGI